MAGLMGVLWMLCWLRQRERSENMAKSTWSWLGELGLWTLFIYLLRMRAFLFSGMEVFHHYGDKRQAPQIK